MSIFAAFRAFAFVSQFYILLRKDTENAKYAKNIYHFSQSFALSHFSQSPFLSRKNAENAKYAKNIYPFSQPFALSHFFAIIYFIAKGRGKRGIRGNLGIYFGATIEHHLSICASFALLT